MMIDSVPINYKTLIVAGGASIVDIDNRSAATKMGTFSLSGFFA